MADERDLKITTPVYQQIAVDLASKISEQQYKVGDKLYARSALASQYGVSPETARRAISILSDLDIVDTIRGSGVVVKSYENAVRFLRHYNDIHTLSDLKKDILRSVERQKEEIEFLINRMNNLLDRTDRFRAVNPFLPFKVTIHEGSPYINKSISDLHFWQRTAATIVAIRRGDTLLLSPGPYAVFHKNDIIYFIGDEGCPDRVQNFLFPGSVFTASS